MTSTNDGKDVKSNHTSGPKGKTYYIELYKSLDTQLTAGGSLSERVTHIGAAWRRVHTLCLHSASSTHPHLLNWIQRHTATTVLQSTGKEEQPKLEQAFNDFTQECLNAAESRNGVFLYWESELLARAAWFKGVLSNLWGHPVLQAFSNWTGECPSTEEILEWLKEERGIFFAARLRQLALSKCQDIALRLVSAVMDATRASREVVTDLDLTNEDKEAPESTSEGPTFESILSTEAGFSEVWDLLTDIELVLLHKSGLNTKVIDLAKLLPLGNGNQIVDRLLSRLEAAPREKKLWKNAKDVAILVAQVMITRCMVVPVCAGAVRPVLYWCARALVRAVPAASIARAANTLAAPASSARHLHTLATAVHAQQSVESDELKPFVVELYVRAITVGMNELEKLKLKPEYEEKEARATEQTLASWFIQLGHLLARSARMKCECVLTAFSVHPSPAMYERIKNAPALPAVAVDTQPKQKPESTSEFGSWANDSRSQTNFVKTSEHLNMQQSQHQANVLSTAILNDGEALGLDAELCQDIIVLLSGPRVKTLSWDVDRKLLLDNCRVYMERTQSGTRALTTELKYLNLDPSQYQHLPEDQEDEDDVYYGIEKGYEHLVEIEPQPEQIWEDAYYDLERTDSVNSSDYCDQAPVQRRKKKTKHHFTDSESDPLSMVAEKKEKKKERPHSKERSKERQKKTKDLDKSKDVKEKDKEHAERRKDEPKDKKKEKKERKKREKKEKKAKNPLIGVKVTTVSCDDASNHNICVTDSDYNSLGRNSIDETVVYDGQFSMDELKSPERSNEDVNKNQMAAAALQKAQNRNIRNMSASSSVQSPVTSASSGKYIPNMGRSSHALREEVKKSITKLLQFRRQKMSESLSSSPMSSPNQTNKSPVTQNAPHSPLLGPKISNTSNVHLNKKQYGLLNTMKGEAKSFKAIFYPPSELETASTCSRVQPFNPAYSRKIPRYSPHMSDAQQSSEALNLSQQKTAIFNNSLNQPSQQSQGIRIMPPSTLKSPQIYNSTHLSSYEKFLQELKTNANAGLDDYNVTPRPTTQKKKQIKPVSKVTPVIPFTTNTEANMKSAMSNMVETENRTTPNVLPMKTDPRMNPTTHNMVKTETKVSPNVHNMVKTNTEVSSTVYNMVKTEKGVTVYDIVKTEPKVSSTMHTMVKQEPMTSPQCAKPVIQSKKVENAPNTFARLSYMHKNKLNDKSKQVLDVSSSLQTSISEELDRRIAELKSTKMKMYSSKNDCTMSRVGNTAQASKPKETPRVEVQKIENPSSAPMLNQQHPLLVTILKKAGLTITSSNETEQNASIEKPRAMQKKTALTEKDQQELLMLLNQQNLLNKPQQQPITANTQPSKIVNTQQFVNNTSNIDSNKCTVKPETHLFNRPVTPKPTSVQEQGATTQSKGRQQFDGMNFKFPLISDTTIMKTTAMLQNKCKKQKAAKQAKVEQNQTVLEVNKAVAKKYVPKPPMPTPQYKADVQEQDWTKVLDAIRSHKTPSRGPNALDMLLNKASFEKVNEWNQHTNSPTLTNKTIKQTPSMATQVNSTIQSRATSKTLTSCASIHVEYQPGMKNLLIKEQNTTVVKKSTPTNPLILYPEVTKEPHQIELHKEADPFISGIPNSDYEILEELMDDDLRQEIGELLSDEESYRAPTVPSTKGPKNNGNKNQTVNKKVTVSAKKPVDAHALGLVHTKPNIINTSTSSAMSENIKAKPQIISNEKVDITKWSKNLIGAKIFREEPTTMASKLQDGIIYNVNNTIASANLTSTTPTTFYNTAPKPSVHNMVIIDAYGMSRNINQGYVSVKNSPNVVYQQFTAPVASQIIIRNNFIPIPTTIQSAATVNVVYNNDSQIIQSDVPTMHIPETTPMTYMSAPKLKQIKLVDAKPLDAASDRPLGTTNVKSLETVRKDLDTPTVITKPKAPEFKSNPKLTNIAKQCVVDPKLTNKVDMSSSKINERKVLSEVQEKLTKIKVDTKVSEKKDTVKNKKQTPSFESEKNEEASRNQERLTKKRLAIINRKINNSSVHPVIPLTYSPIKAFKAAVKVQEKLTVLQSRSLDSPKFERNKTTEVASQCATNQINLINAIHNSKENEINESCRRIMLRSSNKVESKVIAIENKQKLVGRKTKVRLKYVDTIHKLEENNEGPVTDTKLDDCNPEMIKNVEQVNKDYASTTSDNGDEKNKAVVEKAPLTRLSKRILNNKIKKSKDKGVKSQTIETITDSKKKQPESLKSIDVRTSQETEDKVVNSATRNEKPIPVATQEMFDLEEAIVGTTIPKATHIVDKYIKKRKSLNKLKKIKSQNTSKRLDTEQNDLASKVVVNDIEIPSFPEICENVSLDRLKGNPRDKITKDENTKQINNRENKETYDIDTNNKETLLTGKAEFIVIESKNEEKSALDKSTMKSLDKTTKTSEEKSLVNVPVMVANKSITDVDNMSLLAERKLGVDNKMSKLVNDIESVICAITESTISSPILDTLEDKDLNAEVVKENDKIETLVPAPANNTSAIALQTENHGITAKTTALQSDRSDKNKWGNISAVFTPAESVKEQTNKTDNKTKEKTCDSKTVSGTITVDSVKDQKTEIVKSRLQIKKPPKAPEVKTISNKSIQKQIVEDISTISKNANPVDSVKDQTLNMVNSGCKESANSQQNKDSQCSKSKKITSTEIDALSKDQGPIVNKRRVTNLTEINRTDKEGTLKTIMVDNTSVTQIVKDSNYVTSDQLQNNTSNIIPLNERPFLKSVIENKDKDCITLSSESDLASNSSTVADNTRLASDQLQKSTSNIIPLNERPFLKSVIENKDKNVITLSSESDLPSNSSKMVDNKRCDAKTKMDEKKSATSDIPQSFKDSIEIKEIPIPGNTIPNKRCVRIKLPNDKTFKATVTGKLNVSFDTLFEDPALKHILLSSMNNKKCYTLNVLNYIQQISSTDHRVVETVIQGINCREKKSTPETMDIVNLISDDEDEPIRKITTESGSFKVKYMDQEILKKHQQKLSQKCVIKLKRCDNKPKTDVLVEALIREGVTLPPPAEIIEIDDSSSDSEFSAQTGIDVLKNILLKELGVIDPLQKNNSMDDKPNEIQLTNERPSRTRKSKYHRERSSRPISKEPSLSRPKRSENCKISRDQSISQDNSEATKQKDGPKIITRECYIKLTNCDNLVKDFCKVQDLTHQDAIRSVDDQVDECNVDYDNMPVMSRSGSLSILNELDGLDEPLTNADGGSSPVMRVFETIHALCDLNYCGKNLSVLEAYDMIVALQNRPANKEIPAVAYRSENKLCQSDWFETKHTLHLLDAVNKCGKIDDIFQEIVQSKPDSSNDCETDAAIADNENIHTEITNIPSLISIMSKYFADNPIIYKLKPIAEMNDVTKTPLKRKSQDSDYSLSRKVAKTSSTHSPNSHKAESLKTDAIKEQTETSHKDIKCYVSFASVAMNSDEQKYFTFQPSTDSTVQRNVVVESSNSLDAPAKDKCMKIYMEDNPSNQDIMTELNLSSAIILQENTCELVSDFSKDEFKPQKETPAIINVQNVEESAISASESDMKPITKTVNTDTLRLDEFAMIDDNYCDTSISEQVPTGNNTVIETTELPITSETSVPNSQYIIPEEISFVSKVVADVDEVARLEKNYTISEISVSSMSVFPLMVDEDVTVQLDKVAVVHRKNVAEPSSTEVINSVPALQEVSIIDNLQNDKEDLTSENYDKQLNADPSMTNTAQPPDAVMVSTSTIAESLCDLSEGTASVLTEEKSYEIGLDNSDTISKVTKPRTPSALVSALNPSLHVRDNSSAKEHVIPETTICNVAENTASVLTEDIRSKYEIILDNSVTISEVTIPRSPSVLVEDVSKRNADLDVSDDSTAREHAMVPASSRVDSAASSPIVDDIDELPKSPSTLVNVSFIFSATTISRESNIDSETTVPEADNKSSKIKEIAEGTHNICESGMKLNAERMISEETEQTDEVRKSKINLKIVVEESGILVNKSINNDEEVQHSDKNTHVTNLNNVTIINSDKSNKDKLDKKEIVGNHHTQNIDSKNMEQTDIKDNNNKNSSHGVLENPQVASQEMVKMNSMSPELDVQSEVIINALDMDDNYVYETEIVVKVQDETNDLDLTSKILSEKDQEIKVNLNLTGKDVIKTTHDCFDSKEIIVENTIKEVDFDENVFEKNATLVYKDDSGVILKGVQYEDPEIGTCYVFPLKKSSDERGSSEVLGSSFGSTIEVIQEIEITSSEGDMEHSTELYDETDLKVIESKVTYSKRNLKRKSDMRYVTCSEKKSRRSSRGKESTEIKLNEIKYRKGKNIDIPKFKLSTGNVKDFKRRLDYYNTVGFSYSITYSTEFIDASDLLKKWPISGPVRTEILDEDETEHLLFAELDNIENPIRDPLRLTLMEEISSEYVNSDYLNWHTKETNFNMGFGEGSGRVIQNLDDGTFSKFSAATLSDVKQQTQPCLLSEKYYDSAQELSNFLKSSKQEQLHTMKQYLTCMQLKEKVRSFFKSTSFELTCELDKKDSTENYDKSSFPFELFNSKCIEPFPIETVVQVVQVGQLPVSAAAQNPVTCDPRVTQVSDASPSQCSVENSPHDDSHPEIKTEYTELTTADLSLPLVDDYVHHNQTLPLDSQDSVHMSNNENIPIQTELVKSEVKIEIVEEQPEEKESNEISDANNHINNVEYLYDTNNTNQSVESEFQALFDSDKQDTSENNVQQRSQNEPSEKTDQIAHAMNAAGITTTSETANTRAQALVNILTQKLRQGAIATTPNSTNNYPKATSINAMTLQQALASILPPPLNQTSSSENNQQGQNNMTPQILHIVQGKNASGNQITLVDNPQQSVITTPNATPVLHIVQNKSAVPAKNTNGSPAPQSNTFSGLSLVDAGLQQGGNQLLHIVNTGNQKNNNAGQLLKRVNLLTNLANVQGSNEQKMVQFVCKSADGKAIQLNAPHQRSMVLRLQPIESPNVQPATPKSVETNQDMSSSQSTANSATNKDSGLSQQEIKSRSVYEENYAKFIQNSSNKPTLVEKSNSLPKFNQAFGKAVFQDGNQKQSEMNSNSLPSVNTSTDNPECPATDNAINLGHIGQISSPPLLLRKSPAQTTQAQQNLVQQIKQTIAPMNIQTMHGGVIYTRQIPVNIGGGQTINLITVPSTELIDESGQKQQVNQGETIEPSIIKIVPQSQPPSNAEVSDDMNNDNAQQSTPQPQPVLTQMRIKLPMLSKTPQMVSGARVVRPSFFQIQRNVIGGGNQAVYQQLVLTAAPPLGHQTIRLPQAQARQIKVPENQSSSESQMSSSTLEQLREFDMVLEQVKERSTVQPTSNSSSSFKLHTTSTDTTDSPATATTTSAETTQVLYSIGSSQPLNVTYVNRKPSVSTPTTSTFVRSPDSSGIADSPTSSSHSHIPHTSTSEASSSETTTHHKPVKVSSKSKSRPKSSSHPPNSIKLNSVPPKTSTQKPLEDEQTTQRILYILAEYKEQVENSPDKDKPAPRRRSNPPSNPGSSKRKKSSSGSRRSGRDISPIHGDDTCRTMGSEDSSCGTSQGDCTESCVDSHSPQDSPRKVARKLAFEPDPPATTQPRPQPQRNVIVADGQTITVARGTAGKPATAVLMPANYILPVSMVKGGQQIAIVTNRGPKLLTVGGEGGATNALLLQRLIGPAGLKPVLTRPGVRHVRLPTAALHNLQAFNLATATSVQPPDSTASPAPDPPQDLMDTNRAGHSPWTEREMEIKPDRASSPDESEPWNMPSSADPHDYTYEETVRADNMDRTVLDPIQDRYSPDMEAQRIFDKMFDVDTKKSYIVDSPRCAYDIDASDCDDKPYQVVHKKDSNHRQTRLSHVSAAALRHKYAILEHELRLQKSLSEECEDLGVDSPSASELFPEAELLFATSPAQDHGQDTPQHSHTPQPTLLNQSVIQPDIDDQIATDHLLPRHNIPDNRHGLDVNLGLEDVGIVTVSEDGMQATIALDQEEFARAHPNTTFHSEPTDEGEVQPFTISGLKSRHITSTIFHSNRAPATVLMTAPQTTVISQATAESSHNTVKYSDIDNMIHSIPSTHTNNINLSSVLVKDDGLTRFDNILTDTRELHLSNTASAIVHSASNATQVIRRVCYDDSKRERESFLMDEPDALIAGDDAKMVAEDSSRDATLESMGGDDDNSLPERHAELFWESNSASERSESRRPLDFSSDSEKCCKSPSYDETNSTDSSGVGTHMRLDSVIKEARGVERSGSADGSSADDTHPPLRTYPPKRLYHSAEGEMERSLSGKTRAGERSPDMEVRRRASGRGVVKRGCHCCNGSPAPPRPKKARQRKPTMDFTN